jgi:hypothetical protein
MNSGFLEVNSEQKSLFTFDRGIRLSVTAGLLIATGTSLILWASLSDSFRNSETVLTRKFCLPLAGGLSLIFAGLFVRTKLKTFIFWVCSAIIGQAASLQLIDAGRHVHFQHYRRLPEITSFELFSIALILVQVGAVLWGTQKYLQNLKSLSIERKHIRRLFFVIVCLMLSGTALSPDFSLYANDLAFAFIVQIVGFANIVLAVGAFPNESREKIRNYLVHLLDVLNPFNSKFSLDGVALAASVWSFLISALFCFYVYQKHPHVPDEVQYLFQANYFAAGHLTVEAPAVPEAFSIYMIPWRESRWFSIFTPGWAALLALGLKCGAVWLVNPLLTGFSVSLTFWLLRRIYSLMFARLGVILLSCSPWFLFMGMSFMSHMAVLALTLTATVLLIKFSNDKRKTYLAASGIAIGMMSLIRPLDATICAILGGIWLLAKISTSAKSKLFNSLIFAAGVILAGSLIFPYNNAVTGNALLSPMDFYYTNYFWTGANSYGFGTNRGMHWGLDAFPGHSPLEAAINAVLNIFQLNTELFGWATGSLVLILIFLSFGKFTKRDFSVLAVMLTIAFGYGLFWYHGGPDFGARYWFLMIVPLIILTLRGAQTLSEKLSSGSSEFDLRVIIAITILCAASLVNYFPWRSLDKYYHYLEMQPGAQQLARDENFGKSLVIIRGDSFSDYQSAWIYSSFEKDVSAPIYAFDASPEIRARLIEAYSDRPSRLVDGPSITGNGKYRISQNSPLSDPVR